MGKLAWAVAGLVVGAVALSQFRTWQAKRAMARLQPLPTIATMPTVPTKPTLPPRDTKDAN